MKGKKKHLCWNKVPRVTLEIVLSLGHERLISEIKVKSQHCRPARTLGTGKEPGRELNH